MSYNSRNSSSSISGKIANCSYIQKINVMCISSFVRQSGPRSLGFWSCTIMRNALKGWVSLYSMRNLIRLMSSPNAYPRRPMWPSGRRAIALTWVFCCARFWLGSGTMLIVCMVSLQRKSRQKIKPWWNASSLIIWKKKTKPKAFKNKQKKTILSFRKK